MTTIVHDLDALPPLLRYSTVAQVLDVHERTARKLGAEGHLHEVDVTQHAKRVTKVSLVAFIERHGGAA